MFLSFFQKNVSAIGCACKIENQKEVLTRDGCNSKRTAEMYTDPTAGDGCRCFCEKTNKITGVRINEIYCADFKSINTAVGCIPFETEAFMVWLLPKLFGIFGGIAFLLMVYGFILLATSSGDEKRVQGAKETITSAVVGLMVSLSALFILRLIAIDILHIPGF